MPALSYKTPKNKTMRKLILTTILFMCMGTIVFAQKTDDNKQKKTPEERAKHATDALDKKLSLSADQKSKIYTLNLESFKKAKESHVKGEKRDFAKMKASLDERDSKINTILDDKQRETYSQWKAKKLEARKEHHKKIKG